MRPLLDIFYRAYEIEVTTRHLWEETRRWWRFNEQQRRTLRDGLSVPQSGIDGLQRHIIEWTMRNGDPKRWFSRISTRSTLSTLRKGFASARGIVLLTTATNQQVDWIRAGRAFARAHLGLTQLGLTCTPNSQVLQEYPEMAALQREYNELIGVRDPQKVQMALPRRPGRTFLRRPTPRPQPVRHRRGARHRSQRPPTDRYIPAPTGLRNNGPTRQIAPEATNRGQSVSPP